MMRSLLKRILTIMLSFLMVISLLPSGMMTVFAAEGTLTVIEGFSASYTGDGTWDAVNKTEIKGNVTGTTEASCGSQTKKTSEGTLTFTNTGETETLLTFDYELTKGSGNGSAVVIDGQEVTAGSSFSKAIAAQETLVITLKSGEGSDSTTEINISNLKGIGDESYSTTFLPAQNGSYTVNGETVSGETVKTQSALESYALSAIPAAGYKFVGWYNETTQTYLSSENPLSVNISEDTKLKPVFTEELNPVFSAGAMNFTDLAEAVSYAEANSIAIISLASDGILTGSYTIPVGMTLLIPFDESNTCYTTTPVCLQNSAGAQKAFRTLTMGEGASLSVEGGLSVGGQYKAAAGSSAGFMTGNYGYINMKEGSSISVKDGGALYAWGFISGNGFVNVESGGDVYEWFQIADFRGGTASLGIGNRVFYFSQYFVQNIEVPLTIQAGASENVYTGIYASGKITPTAIRFIGNGGMFELERGSFTKDYDPTSDRMEYTISGEIAVNSLSLTLMGMPVSSEGFVFPITNNITLSIASGEVKVNQDLALLAGAKVEIAKDAALTVSAGHNVYVYDRDEWTAANYVTGGKFKSVGYSPSKSYNRTDNDLTDARVDINGILNAAGAVYTTAGGAELISSQETGKYVQQGAVGTETTTYQYTQSGSTVTKCEINITPAKLQNTNGTYTETAKGVSGDIWNYKAGIWEKFDSEQTYTVIWTNEDGTVLETDTEISYGTIPEFNGATPAKEGNAQYSYTFSGWTPEISEVTGDVTYKAVYEQKVNQYAVTWKNWDGKILVTDTVDYGDVPEYKGDIPSREGDAEHTYVFSGWTPEITAVTEDAEYTAAFVESVNTYTVTWKNWDGTVLEQDEDIAYGATPEYSGVTPVREGDAQYSYSFKGWTPQVDTVTGDITYTAVYEQTTNEYTITWKNGDIVLKEEQIPYGTTPVYSGETPIKEGNAQYSYTFSGWAPEIVSVTEDAVYTAEFEETVNTYTVTWLNADGTELEKDENVPYGNKPEYNGAAPEKVADEEYTYTFSGWTPELTEDTIVNGDMTFTAKYNKEPLVHYTVTFDPNGGKGEMEDQVFTAGVDQTLNENTFTRENHVFTGWNTKADGTGISYADRGAVINLTEDITLYAQWRILDGLWNSGEDIYWMQGGEIVKDAGLIRIVLESGEVNYYYFGTDGKAYKATEEQKHFTVEKNNGLKLPEGIKYEFGTDGVIKHFADTSINGIYQDSVSNNYYYCIDGVIIANGLMKIDGSYYYARTSTGAFVTNQSYWITKTNGLLEEGIYQFDENGKIVFPEEEKDGIVEENGSLYYYVAGKLTGAGLIRIDGDYYYVRTGNAEVIHGREYWITSTNGLMPSGVYTFAEDGKMLDPQGESLPEEKDGIVEERGSLYYYVDGVLTGAGLIQIDGHYYYVRTSTGEVVHGRTYWITDTNDLPLPAAQYEFADDGKLILK